ncbi:hypothetical protein, partial [Hydrogenophaga sp.]|uniref:hypothetical protein n=1 Tax=Hydrogenophaga sp. TaxID=1904254 RepID=UPI00286E538C
SHPYPQSLTRGWGFGLSGERFVVRPDWALKRINVAMRDVKVEAKLGLLQLHPPTASDLAAGFGTIRL